MPTAASPSPAPARSTSTRADADLRRHHRRREYADQVRHRHPDALRAQHLHGRDHASAGDIRVQSSAALGTTAGATTVATGAAIEIDGSGLSIAEPITSLIGTGIGGAGALRNLANDNTWTGLITMGAGGATVNSDAGTLTLSGGFAGNARPLTVGAPATRSSRASSPRPPGTLTKTGAGTLTLAARQHLHRRHDHQHRHAGAGHRQRHRRVSAVTVSAGATFDLAGFSDTVGSLAGAGSLTSTVAGAVTLTSGGNNTTTTYSGVASDGAGVLALTKSGTGTLTLSGLNTYTGATSISAGSLSVAADTALGTPPGSPTPGQLVFNGGTLLATASFTLDPNRGITLTGAGTLNVNAGLTLSYAGIIAGAGALTKSGTGTLTLSGLNTYTGATTISAGSLSVAADTALGTPPGSPHAGPAGLQRRHAAGHRQLHARSQPGHHAHRRRHAQRQRRPDADATPASSPARVP